MTAPMNPTLTPWRGRLLTAADLAVLPSELPSGPVRYELDNGRLVILPVHSDAHGAVEVTLASELKVQGERQGAGKARCGGVGVILWRDPDRVIGADALFLANTSLPVRRSPEDYLETVPDLIVEVCDPWDTVPEIRAKVDDCLTAGVRVVWVADPETRTVTAHRPGRPPHVFTDEDPLTVEDILPGFRMPVRDVFRI
jgi:Uma2 family endonuclease